MLIHHLFLSFILSQFCSDITQDAKNASRSAFAKSLKMPNVAGIISPLFSDDAVMEVMKIYGVY